MNDMNRAIAPAVNGFPPLALPVIDRTELDNGVKFISLNTGSQPIVQLTLVWEGGLLDFDNPALPSIVAATLRDGCDMKSGDAIEYTFDYNGAWFKSEMRDHNAVITITSLSSKLNKILPLIREVISAPNFPQQRVDRQKDKMIASWELQRKKVDYQAERAATCQIAGKNHPITVEVTPDRIIGVSRDDMLKAQPHIYSTTGMSAYLAGCVNTAEMDEVLKFLESLPTDCGAVTCRLRPFAPDYAGSEVVVDHPGALQSAVVMSIPAIDRSHPDYCALRLATMALGGYFGSRLMTNLREDKGLTYGVTAGLYGYREGSAVMVSTQCDNRSVKSVVDETVNEIKKLADNPPEGEELNRLIQTASTGLASILDSPFNVINHIAAERLTGTPVDYFDRQQTAVASLSAETIGNCARRYLDPDKMLIAVVGDCSTMVK